MIVSSRPRIGTACDGAITGAPAPVWRRQSSSWVLFLSCVPADSILAIAFRCTLGLARKAPRARTMEMGTTRPGTFDDAHVTTLGDNSGFLLPFRERARLVARKRLPLTNVRVVDARVIWLRINRCVLRARSDSCESGSSAVVQVVQVRWLDCLSAGTLSTILAQKAVSSRSAF